MNPEFEAAVKRISEVVMFENWLRFYFIAEEGDRLLLRLPPQAEERLKAEVPQLFGLAESLNNREVDHQTSVQEVCVFVSKEIDGVSISEDRIGRVFDSIAFQLELQLFSSWVQAHEEQLDETFMNFPTWMQLYTEWKSQDKVADYAKRIKDSLQRTVVEGTATTQ